VYNQIKAYLKFLSKSTNQHGVHSPFVYDLITKCFYNNDQRFKSKYQNFDSFRNSLLSEKKTIEVTDYGAGSRVFKNDKRSVNAITKTAGISKKEAKLIIKIVNYFKPENILELGTSVGLGTYCFYLGNPEAKITTLEGCPNTAQIAIDHFKKYHSNNIDVIIGDFKETLPEIIDKGNIDFVYFDGNHQKEPTLNYFNQCLKMVHNETIFIFDDIYWSKEMEDAWNTIRNHPKITVSIDTFFWGIVFFRKEQPKQHFYLRV
jgi:predicted O-methyltransferase YrrM